MEVVNERCAGLDVHKKTVVACVITPEIKKTRTFGAMPDDLLQMCDWLTDQRVTHVAMESTGVYWKPVYNLLEVLNIELLVVNAQHVKAVPGRKTDVKDAEWIADLLRHGLLRGSYIPDRDQRELRELVRYRRSLTQEKAKVVNRIQKVLEGANIKLSSVATNVVGVTGRAMLKAISEGVDDPEELMHVIKGRLHSKKAALKEAMKGLIGPHQRMMLRSQLRHLAFLAWNKRSRESRRDITKDGFHRRRDRPVRCHTRSGKACGRRRPCRDGLGHESVPHICTSRILGEGMSRQQRERRQANQWGDGEGDPLASLRSHRGRMDGRPFQEHLPIGPVQTDIGPGEEPNVQLSQ